MKVLKQLTTLALSPLLGDRANTVVELLSDRFGDAGRRLPNALQQANDRAWRALEVSLAGPSMWQRCKQMLSPREEQAFRRQIQQFLEQVPLPDVPGGGTEFREFCFRELQAARKARLIPGGQLDVKEVNQLAEALKGYDDPRKLLQAELQTIGVLANDLAGAGYGRLSRLVALSPPNGRPLLVVAVRYFFRREVESDPQLSAGLMFQQLEDLSETQQAGFQGLHETLDRHADVMTNLLEDIHDLVTETRDEVRALKEEMQRVYRRSEAPAAASPDLRDMRDEFHRQTQQLQEMYRAALELLQNNVTGQARSAPPAGNASAGPQPASTSAAPEDATVPLAWSQVRDLVARCRAIPKEKQEQMPVLFNALAKLKVAAGPECLKSAKRVADPPKDVLAAPASPSEKSARTAEPTLRRVKSPTLNPLFRESDDNAASETDPPPTIHPQAPPTRGKRLVSPLFLKSSEPPAENRDDAPESSAPS